MNDILFTPYKISNIEIKNRFIRSATWRNLASKNFSVSPKYFQEYDELSKGGCGLVFSGAMFVNNYSQLPGFIHACNKNLKQDFSSLLEHFKANNCAFMAQLTAISGINPVQKKTIQQESYGASSIANTMASEVNILTEEQLENLADDFKKSAKEVYNAGFAGIQVHSAHGYLLSSFLTPKYNHRKDCYGGTLENRSRLLLKIISSIKKAVPDNFPLTLKINCCDFLDNGFTVEDCISVCKSIQELGVHAVEISGGNKENPEYSWYRTKLTTTDKESYFYKYAAEIADKIEIPIILVGGNRSYSYLNEIINNSKIKFISLSRPLLREPNLINKWCCSKNYKLKCISCNKCWNKDGNFCIFNLRKKQPNLNQ